MNRNWVQVYAASTCFAAVICMAVAVGALIYSIVRIAAPYMTVSSDQAQPYIAVTEIRSTPPGAAINRPAGPPNLSGAESDRIRLEGSRRAMVYMKAVLIEGQSGRRGLIYWTITLLVSSVLWFLHWRMLRG